MDNFTSNTYHMTEAPQGMSGGWNTICPNENPPYAGMGWEFQRATGQAAAFVRIFGGCREGQYPASCSVVSLMSRCLPRGV